MKMKTTTGKGTMQYMLDGIKYICQTFRNRAPGSESERNAQDHFAGELKQWADDVQVEDFTIHRGSFMGWIPPAGIIGVISALLYWFRGDSTIIPVISTVLLALAASCFMLQFILYRRYVDFLFPKATSRNVMAVRKPSGETKRRIIFCGHADAAHEWTYSYHGQIKTLAPVMGGSIGGLFITLAINFVLMIVTFVNGPVANTGIWKALGILQLILIPFFIAICFFINWKCIVDGANDNLTACYISMGVLKDMAEADFRYENTEVCCLIVGSEEAGLRGSLAYAERHKEELMATETVTIAMDTMNEIEVLEIYTQGQTGTVKDSEAVGELIHEAGLAAGIDMKRTDIYPGAIDSEAFSRNGLLAAGFCGVNHNPQKYYHTREDTWDNINPKCIELSLNICKNAANLYDENGGIAAYEEKAKHLKHKKRK